MKPRTTRTALTLASLAVIATISLAAGAAGCDRSTGRAPPPPPAPGLSPEDVALGRRLDAAIDQAITGRHVVGAVVLVARDGAVIYRRAAGLADRESSRPATLDTLFRLASMTKPIVSAAALALVDQGKLRLDDPVTRWLPDFRPKLADGREATITVRHLLTHTSGLGYAFAEPPGGPYHQAGVSDGLAEPGRTFDDNARRLASVPLLFQPGTQWRYGLSTDVLGEVVGRAGGGGLPEVVRRTVTAPLGLPDVVFSVPERDRGRLATPYAGGQPPARMTEPYDLSMGGVAVGFAPSRVFDPAAFPSGGAGAVGTARDYLRFLEALRTGGPPILRPETARAMTADQLGDLQASQGPGRSFGLGVGVVLDPAAARTPLGKGSWMWGGIYGTSFWVDPVARLSVVILTNTAGDGLEHLAPAVELAIYIR